MKMRLGAPRNPISSTYPRKAKWKQISHLAKFTEILAHSFQILLLHFKLSFQSSKNISIATMRTNNINYFTVKHRIMLKLDLLEIKTYTNFFNFLQMFTKVVMSVKKYFLKIQYFVIFIPFSS